MLSKTQDPRKMANLCKNADGVSHKAVWAQHQVGQTRCKKEQDYYRDIAIRGYFDVLFEESRRKQEEREASAKISDAD